MVPLPRKRAVQIVSLSRLAVPGSPKDLRRVYALGVDYRGDGVVEVQAPGPGERGDLPAERLGGERARGHYRDFPPFCGQAVCLPPYHVHERVSLRFARHVVGKRLPVHRERLSRRNPRRLGRLDHQGSELLHLPFQYSRGVLHGGRLERVAAHKLGESRGRVRGGGLRGPHLVEPSADSEPGDPPRRLDSRESPADYRYGKVSGVHGENPESRVTRPGSGGATSGFYPFSERGVFAGSGGELFSFFILVI